MDWTNSFIQRDDGVWEHFAHWAFYFDILDSNSRDTKGALLDKFIKWIRYIRLIWTSLGKQVRFAVFCGCRNIPFCLVSGMEKEAER